MFSIAYGDQRKRGWVRKGSKFSALCDGFCIALRATRTLLDSRCRSVNPLQLAAGAREQGKAIQA